MTGHAWNDNNYEGKLLRKAIGKLAKKLKESTEIDELIKITNAIAFASNTKMNLAKYEYQDKKLDLVLRLLKEKDLVKYNDGALNDIKQLPGQQD
ncbi:hypothetical protein [Nitrososphaeria virus YSH_922147]|uniref:Uncharacterized protein n=1 Tax=Nitrososphaeria virus YSH_922147 TaxID=3071323 RepID=A0A976UBC3_9CAUD|nr:hypothetical protein QKV94_gp13 [Yangshan Harbor Nitrososphaeria virus]UVF62422.1 hypothetical protein [Nitrososphaeria virus YSH_922147]